jgi:LysR family transcriptional regulator, hydrogen peroxide-inducible genes activator
VSIALVTLLPAIAVATETARSRVHVRPLAPPPSRTIVLAWRARSPLASAFATLGETLAWDSGQIFPH